MAGHSNGDTSLEEDDSLNPSSFLNFEHLILPNHNPSQPRGSTTPTATSDSNTLITSPAQVLELRQNNPQDCSNLIIASVNRATVEISRTIIALNATFTQQLKAASASATSGILSAQGSASSTINIVVSSASVATVAAFSSVTFAQLQVTSATVALSSVQSSASSVSSSASDALTSASLSLTSASSASSSIFSASSTEVARLSSSLSLLQASLASAQQVLGQPVATAAAPQGDGGLSTLTPSFQLAAGTIAVTPLQAALILVGVSIVSVLFAFAVYFLVMTTKSRRSRDSYLSDADEDFPISPKVVATRSSSTGRTGNGMVMKFNPSKNAEAPPLPPSALRRSLESVPPPFDFKLANSASVKTRQRDTPPMWPLTPKDSVSSPDSGVTTFPLDAEEFGEFDFDASPPTPVIPPAFKQVNTHVEPLPARRPASPETEYFNEKDPDPMAYLFEEPDEAYTLPPPTEEVKVALVASSPLGLKFWNAAPAKDDEYDPFKDPAPDPFEDPYAEPYESPIQSPLLSSKVFQMRSPSPVVEKPAPSLITSEPDPAPILEAVPEPIEEDLPVPVVEPKAPKFQLKPFLMKPYERATSRVRAEPVIEPIVQPAEEEEEEIEDEIDKLLESLSAAGSPRNSVEPPQDIVTPIPIPERPITSPRKATPPPNIAEQRRQMSPLRRNPVQEVPPPMPALPLPRTTSPTADKRSPSPPPQAPIPEPVKEIVAEEPLADERQTRGRSMIRTSDIIEARLSVIARIKAEDSLPEVEERIDGPSTKIDDRDISPLRRNPYDPSTRARTKSPLRHEINDKRRSSPPPVPAVVAQAPPALPVSNNRVIAEDRDRSSSPLRRNPSNTPKQTKRLSRSLSPHMPALNSISRNDSPLSRNPTTGALIIPEQPLAATPKAKVKIQPSRPLSNEKFASAMDKWKERVERNPEEVLRANNELQNRAVQGIYIPGSLREQAMRNLSKNRDGGGERRRLELERGEIGAGMGKRRSVSVGLMEVERDVSPLRRQPFQ